MEIGVYNVLGQRIKSIYSNSRFSGLMTLAWDGTDARHQAVPAGIYFLRVVAGAGTKSERSSSCAEGRAARGFDYSGNLVDSRKETCYKPTIYSMARVGKPHYVEF